MSHTPHQRRHIAQGFKRVVEPSGGQRVVNQEAEAGWELGLGDGEQTAVISCGALSVASNGAQDDVAACGEGLGGDQRVDCTVRCCRQSPQLFPV